MKKSIKVLIIGDSNCLPHYSKKNIDNVLPEKNYTHLLRKKYKKFFFKEAVWGGVTSSLLINYSIRYYKKWKPNLVIVHSGVNDIKTQLFSEKTNQKIYKIFKWLFNKKDIKEKLIYNPNYLKYISVNKVSNLKLLEVAKKLKKAFNHSKIIWIGIHSSNKIDDSRPNTYKSVKVYNKELKNYFKKNFIDNEFDKIDYTKDGYHLNSLGHKKLFEKINRIIKNYKF